MSSEARVIGRGTDTSAVRVDPRNPDMVYVANTSTYRSTNAGETFTAIKGAPGGDDYQSIWINPTNPAIIALGVDQGATISVNGGQTWSSWYNQPTAQFYHVITDNRFPYWVYGGQQESGSIAIPSRSDSGEITFRDWHTVGVEEYGYIAPDPLDPNMIYGGKATRYNQTTGDVQNIAPVPGRGGGKYRSVRTMPLIFSTVDPHALYLAANVLFKTINGGHSWQVISPDLTREPSPAPPSMGIFAALDAEKGQHRGVIYSVAPSRKDANTIWVGTDDGLIHITRDGNRLRITVRLLDLRAGNQIVWARRFDRQSNDLLSLQDEIASEVVAQIDPEILLIEAKRSSSRPPVDATAYDMVLRAIPLIGRMERSQYMMAGEYLAHAIELEPDYAAAHAFYAYWHIFLVGQGWAEDLNATMVEAGELAERAVVLDPFDARGLTIAGHVRAFLHRRLREAVALHERALSLNPNLAMAWALSAIAFAYMGDPEEAERRNNRYKKLSPLDPHAFFFDAFFILIHLMKRDYESAVAVGRAVSEMNPSFSATYKPYLSALGHLGRSQEAAVVRRRLLMIEPDFTVERFIATSPLERESDRDHYAEGLRLAGVPETAAEGTEQLHDQVAH